MISSQPVTQHLWEKAHSVPLEHFPKLSIQQISLPDGVWMACSLWWGLPVVAPRCIDAPVDVLILGLVWDCSLVQNGGLITHQTSNSSFSASQWRVCCLFLAAACLKSLSLLRAAAAECIENSCQVMDWYFTISSAVLGAIWT